MRLVVVLVALVALAAPGALAANLSKKRKTKHHSSTSTSTSTSTTTSTTTTSTTTTARPLPTTEPSSSDSSGDAEDVRHFDNVAIIKIHLPLPANQRINSSADASADYSTSAPYPVPSSGAHMPQAPAKPEEPAGPVEYTEPAAPAHAADADAADPDAADADAADPDAADPDVADADAADPDAADPDVADPDAADPDAVDPDAADPDAADPDRVVIPDVATFDAVFANHSRLADDIRVFTFGGVYEIVVNRTRNSVEVVMVKWWPANGTSSPDGEMVPVTEVTQQPLQMMVRGPSVTGLLRQQQAAEDELEQTGVDEKGEHAGDEASVDEEDLAGDGAGNAEDDKATSDDTSNDKSKGDEDRPIDKNSIDKNPDSRHSKDQTRDAFDAIFINGSALIGVELGVVRFNTSGQFKLVVVRSDDFMTVIISQMSDQLKRHGVQVPDNVLRFDKPAGAQKLSRRTPVQGPADSGSWAGTVLTVASVAAVTVLLAAVVVWRVRRRARGSSFVRRGEDYGTLEHASEAFDFYANPQ